MSVSAAELPAMAGAAAASVSHEPLRQRLDQGLRQIAFFVVPTVVAFIAIGNVIVAALYQGGRFHASDTMLVWYILIGSTFGLLAATLGRLYSSVFYALRDTKTPLRFAMIRVALTAALGWVFAIPLRPLLIRLLQQAGVPLPIAGGNTAPLGAIALTATAGVAAWVEFLLLRRSLSTRIGAARLPGSYLVRLWISAVCAGIGAATFNIYLLHAVSPIRNGILVCGLFGAIYFGATIALGVPEARATLARFTRRAA
jgi:putative peptidoglycan lipid II flippase